jgi:PAS domain S-box-containing protein
MEVNFSLFNSNDLTNTSASLLQAILDNLSTGIEVLKAVREGNVIVDFKYILLNEATQEYRGDRAPGKRFLESAGDERPFFSRMIAVTETGHSFSELITTETGNYQRRIKYSCHKFEDGLIVTKELITDQDWLDQENSGIREIYTAGNHHGTLEQQVAEISREREENKLLLQSVFDAAANGFSILETVRNKKGKITDFIYKYTNRATEEMTHRIDLKGQRFSKIHSGFKKTGLFDFMVNVVETGKTNHSELHFGQEGLQTWLSITAVKLHEGLLLSLEDITERRQKLQETNNAALSILQQNASLENFKRIVDTTHDGITSLDRDGRVNYWNAAAQMIYGYTKEEAMGRKLDDLIMIANRQPDLTRVMIEVYHEGKSIVDMITQKRKKDGSIVDVLVNLFPLKDETGDITGSCLVSKDVSESKRLKELMRDNAHFISQIVDTTPDIIYLMDLNTYQVIYTNRQIAAQLGYTKQQIAAMKNPVLELIHEDDLPAMIAHLDKMKTLTSDDKVVEIEYRMKKPDGSIAWYCDRNTVFKRNARRVPVEKIGFSQNITERKEQEEQLLTDLDILTQAEELSGMGSWEFHIPTGTFKWSTGMYKLFGLNEKVKPTPEIYFDYTSERESGVITRIVNNIRYDHQPFEETFTLNLAGGQSKTIKIKAIVHNDAKSNPVKMIGVDLDISRQVKAAQEINELNKTLLLKNRDLFALNSELKTFNTITANDYKETLQILYTNLEYVASKDARNLTDSSKANIRRAQAAIQKMKLLTEDINNYLQLYDIGITKTMIDPNSILKKVLIAFEPKLEQTMAKVEMTSLPGMPADPYLFSRLMTNLLDNAIKFRKMILAPLIKIRSSRADEINTVPGAMQNTPYVIISISDNGTGFAEEEHEKIFDLFYRINPKGPTKGSGIGLAICKKIMAMHGGFITAESTPGMGSTFSCYFPGEL